MKRLKMKKPTIILKKVVTKVVTKDRIGGEIRTVSRPSIFVRMN
jgi:hypothetical protein